MLNDGEQVTPWIKADASQGASNCVEVAGLADGGVALRDSKHRDGPVHRYTRGEFAAFLHGAKNGEFDDLAG